jgi:hypothetical protein
MNVGAMDRRIRHGRLFLFRGPHDEGDLARAGHPALPARAWRWLADQKDSRDCHPARE